MTSDNHSEDEKPVDEQPSLPEPYHLLTRDLDLHVEHQRVACFHEWIQQQIAEGHIDEQAINKQDERVGLFTSWLRSLFTQHGMKPKRDLPLYSVFAEAPYTVN